MSITLTPVKPAQDIWGRTRVNVFDLLLDDDYPTGGYTINAQDVGLKTFIGAELIGGDGDQLPLQFGFNLLASAGDLQTSLKLLAYFPTGGATAPTTLSAPTVTPSVGGITAGAITMGGTATGTVPAGGVTVTSTAANGAIISVPSTGLTATAANPTQAASTSALAAGLGKEVGNGGDLGTVQIRVRFTGI